jgi:hypothetical protein
VQELRLDAPSFVALPGDAERWPEDVRVDDEPAAPSLRDGRPELRLEPGLHELRGRFVWAQLPALLAVPQETGLVALRLGGAAVEFPERDELGRLWLRAVGDEAQAGERRIELELHRKVTDEVPLQLETRITLRVSGPAREEILGPVLPGGFLAFALESPLPVRLEADGTLRAQVRPGSFELSLLARQVQTVTEDGAEVLAAPVPRDDAVSAAREVWVFEARPELRLVTVAGVPVDPQQTSLPGEWHQLPAYLLEAGSPLRLTQRRRGNADPVPDELRLQRAWHLDLEGGGATVTDRIEGSFRARARLEMGEGTELGRASVNGADQFLTRVAGSPKVGIQVSPGPVEIVADSRVEASAFALPAVGWDRDFTGLSAVLELPPGYELLHAAGVDRARWSWIERWDLLDLFLVLVVAVAFLRLYGPLFGGLAALTLALTATEPGAPRWVWVAVLAAEALRRAVPAGRFARLLSAARWLCLAALALLAVPFAVASLRAALYPALSAPPSHLAPAAVAELAPGSPAAEEAGTMAGALAEDAAMEAAPEQLRALGYQSGKVRRHIDAARLGRAARAPRASGEPRVDWSPSQDPNARVTTGPGVPTWSWRKVQLEWSGPAPRDAVLRLFLLPPFANALLGILRVLLLGALAARLLGVRFARPLLPVVPPAALLLFSILGAPAPAGGAEFPPPELLDELRARLTEDAPCTPDCAVLSRLGIEARGARLRLTLELSAAAETAVPLPGGSSSWLPAEVRENGAQTRALRRGEDGSLWLRVGAGAHRVELEGPLPPQDVVALPLPLPPRRAEAELEGWTLEGLRPDGSVEAALQLVREAGSEPAAAEVRESQALPPFLRVERSFLLGLNWTASTSVMRLSPPEAALVVEVPLLEGESVTTPEVEVKEGKARLALAPGAVAAGFESVLAVRDQLVLDAPSGVPWSESWRLAASPIWQLTPEGIPPIQADPGAAGADLEWRPWPGESVRVAVARPEGVAGATLTLDSSRLQLRPGVRSTDAELELALRSSQGGEHRVTLPEGATLQRVAIDGREQPLRQEGRAVVLPVRPGTEAVAIAWREAEGIRSFWRAAEVEVGAPSVNAATEVHPPAGRWLLWVSGPPLGPAVLFWPVLAAYLAIAATLGRTRLAPLRGRDWALLALGLTQVGVVGAGVVVLWLLALGARAEHGTRVPGRWFDLLQLALVALTLAALAALFAAIRAGLLGLPDMQIGGYGSSAELLRWYQDRSGSVLPRPRVVSLPLGVYRLAMLLWALWIAQALVAWLRFGWRAFSAGELWRPLRRGRAVQGGPVGGPP